MQKNPTLDDAIKLSSKLYAGMPDSKVNALLKKYGIHPSGAIGGTMSMTISCWLSDNSRLSLAVHFLSRELRDKGPWELVGWIVSDPSGKLMPQFSLYIEPPSHQIKKEGLSSSQDIPRHKNTTLDDAIKVIKELKLGMSDADTEVVLKKHGIQSGDAIGSTTAWKSYYKLSDYSCLMLYYRYLSQELGNKGPSELKGWTLSGPHGKLIPQQ